MVFRQSVRFAVGRPGVQTPCRAVAKILLCGIHSFPAWRSAQIRVVSRKKFLICFLWLAFSTAVAIYNKAIFLPKIMTHVLTLE